MTQSAEHCQAGTAPFSKPQPAKLLDRVRDAIRARHYSLRTEEAYVGWVRRFILFHNKRHPAEMGEPEINEFLTHLAVAENVAASTQNQALSGILFLYQEVLGRNLDRIEGVVRAKKPRRLPVVLSRDEVRAVLGRFSGSSLATCHASLLSESRWEGSSQPGRQAAVRGPAAYPAAG